MSSVGFLLAPYIPDWVLENPVIGKYKNPKQLIFQGDPNNRATSRIVLHHTQAVRCLLLFVSNLGKTLWPKPEVVNSKHLCCCSLLPHPREDIANWMWLLDANQPSLSFKKKHIGQSLLICLLTTTLSTKIPICILWFSVYDISSNGETANIRELSVRTDNSAQITALGRACCKLWKKGTSLKGNTTRERLHVTNRLGESSPGKRT